jgi:sensor histidine kinase YesM
LTEDLLLEKNKIMKTPFTRQVIRFIIISAIISFFIQLINFLGSDFQVEYLLNFKRYAISFSYAFIIGMTNITFFDIILKKYSWQTDAKKLLWLGIAGSVTLSTIAFFVSRLVHYVIILNISFHQFFEMESPLNYIVAVFIALIVTLAFHAYYFYKHGTEAELRAQKEMVEHTKAKHKALQDQLDPHFLFNSLSVLASLIEENPKRATEFTTNLSKVYRYVLEQRQEDLVSIASELDFAKVYLDLLSTRFEDSLEYRIQVTEESGFIVPLSLQLLIENAVKHNKVTEKQPLLIQIFTEGEFLVIQNNLNPKANNSNRLGIGLSNIKSRFKAFTETPIAIKKNADIFNVKLPILQNQSL